LLPGRGGADEDLAYLPKPEPSDSAFGKRSFESRTLFRDVPSPPPARPSPSFTPVHTPPMESANASASYEGGPASRPRTPEISGLPMVIRRKPAKEIPWLSLALVAILCSGATFGVYALNGVGTGSSKLSQVMRVLFPGTDLELRAEGSGDRLLLTWNRRNQVVASAASAVLSITDGPQRFDRKLDPVQIANGSVLYRPISGDVTFRLQVFGTDQAIAIGSLRVLDATAVPSISDGKPVNDKPALDSSNIAAVQRAIPPPPAPKENTPLTNAAPSDDRSASGSNPPPAGDPERSPEQASTNLKTDAPNAQQTPPQSPPAQTALQPQNVTPQSTTRAPAPATIAAKQGSHPNSTPPVTSNTAINGWDLNLLEKKPAPPQEAPAQPVVSPPDAKTVAFIGPKVLLQVMPNVRNLSYSSVDQVTRVEVEVTVDTNGRVKSARLLSPNVKGSLASAALSAARQWTFQPATLRGLRVESDHSIVFEFRPGDR
jgi:TonB family protein